MTPFIRGTLVAGDLPSLLVGERELLLDLGSGSRADGHRFCPDVARRARLSPTWMRLGKGGNPPTSWQADHQAMRYGDISFSSYRKRHGLLDIGQPLFSLNRRVIEAESSLLVLPLVHERFGLLLPEAMAAGLPSLARTELERRSA